MAQRENNSFGLLAFFIILLFQLSYSDDSCSSCEASNECSSLDFTNCSRKSCNNTQEEKIIVCYFTNWAWYRDEPVNFRPENINSSLCTHIFYAFSSLDTSTLLMASSDTWADIDNKFYELVVAFKNFGLKVLLSIGGWNNSGGSHWSNLVNNATARANFVSTTVAFLKKYNFDGLDMDYEYPGCPQGNLTAGLPTDKKNFNLLVFELKQAFNKSCGSNETLLLTVTMAAGKSIIKDCYYNISELCCIADWINIMAYDYHSYSDGYTGANAPICGTGSSWGVYDTVKYYVKVLKCPADKLVLGLPFYGKTYTMENCSKPEFGVNTTGAGTAGPFTQTAGTIAYHEICININSGWKSGCNSINGSYAWNSTGFISYDSKTVIRRKACLINKYFNMKGAMIWALDFDDFNDICGNGSYPLLKTLNQQLRG